MPYNSFLLQFFHDCKSHSVKEASRHDTKRRCTKSCQLSILLLMSLRAQNPLLGNKSLGNHNKLTAYLNTHYVTLKLAPN